MLLRSIAAKLKSWCSELWRSWSDFIIKTFITVLVTLLTLLCFFDIIIAVLIADYDNRWENFTWYVYTYCFMLCVYTILLYPIFKVIIFILNLLYKFYKNSKLYRCHSDYYRGSFLSENVKTLYLFSGHLHTLVWHPFPHIRSFFKKYSTSTYKYVCIKLYPIASHKIWLWSNIRNGGFVFFCKLFFYTTIKLCYVVVAVMPPHLYFVYRKVMKYKIIFYHTYLYKTTWIFKFLNFFLCVYFLLYKNYWGLAFNYIFYDPYDPYRFIFWSNECLAERCDTFISLLNLDNIFLLYYVCFWNIGIVNLIVLGLLDGAYTMYDPLIRSYNRMMFRFQPTNPNYCHFKGWFDECIWDVYFAGPTEVVQKNIVDFYKLYCPGFSFGFLFFCFLLFTTIILSWLFLSYLGLYGVFILNFCSLVMFWLFLLFSFKSFVVNQEIHIIKIFNWIFLTKNTKVDFFFLIDSISFSFMLLTTTIALFVYIYAFSYFRHQPLMDRFLLFLLSFVISMIFLVISGNTIMLFLGWELIGFTSFCLINFWTPKASTLKSGFKAFVFNKISDFFMFIFLVLTFFLHSTFDISVINEQSYKYELLSLNLLGTSVSYLEFIALMILGASFIKSAQIGGHVWLPDSMEAPVPASALIHSATLVSAGIYMILRFNLIFDVVFFCKFLIPVIGSLTAAYGGVSACSQTDIKKILAYSTISHCGFLMVLCATEMNEFTILYLYAHGFFKAVVFMCVGNVLRISNGCQDVRRMGGFLKYLPFEYYCILIGLLNLAGLPFTFGFFIKHLLFINLGNHFYLWLFVLINCLVGAFSGLFYSYIIVYYTFIDFKKGYMSQYNNYNRINYNSVFYTNSSKASTISIFFLFLVAYVILYFLFKYFMYNKCNFSDYMNTTITSNFFSTKSSFGGSLLNFSYINWTVALIFFSIILSRFRKIPRFANYLYFIYTCVFAFIFIFVFYNLLS